MTVEEVVPELKAILSVGESKEDVADFEVDLLQCLAS